MKSPTSVVDDCDDIFGPPRTYATGYCQPKTRPSMICAKYRQKEERRKVLKISINKLKKIEDPEASLCRSVLINNTMKRLQREAKEEKQSKQQFHYHKYDNDDTFVKNSSSRNADIEICDFTPSDSKIMDSLKADFESDFDKSLVVDAATDSSKLCEMVHESLTRTFTTGELVVDSSVDLQQDTEDRITGKKRSYHELDDCDVQDVLSQFYMPPTPRMLTSIDDDDEDVNVVDDEEPLPKRTKLAMESAGYSSSPTQFNTLHTPHHQNNNNITKPVHTSDDYIQLSGSLGDSSRLCFTSGLDVSDSSSSSHVNNGNNAFSCGHSSLFTDLQNNVFHNLIASLET